MSYNKNHGTNVLKKHTCHEHPYFYKKWGLLHRVIETQCDKQGTKKRKIVPLSQIIDFFGNQQPYHKLDSVQQAFLEDMVLFVTKGY